MSDLTIGIDIGGTSVRAAPVTAQGELLEVRTAATPRTVPETEAVLTRLIGELADRHQVSAVGLAVAGFVSTDRTHVMFAPHLAWRDDPVPERLSSLVGMPVVMDHDVNSAAWAEYRLGAGGQARVALLVALGTGIGAGLVVQGQIYRGAHGVAPELGHVVLVPDGRPCPCGKRGCWERYCSGTALAVTAAELFAARSGPKTPLGVLCDSDPSRITGAMVSVAADQGDPDALAALDELARWLGVGLAMATDILDPEVLLLGGGVAAAAPHFLPTATEVLLESITGAGHRPAPRIELAAFGGNAGIVGAALLARDAVPAR